MSNDNVNTVVSTLEGYEAFNILMKAVHMVTISRHTENDNMMDIERIRLGDAFTGMCCCNV